MRIDEGLRQHWAEPREAELFQPLRDGGEQATAHEQGTTAPPPEPPPSAFWESAPVQANALNDLPPAPQAQAAEVAAATPAQATAAPVTNTTGTATAATYAGEPPADPQWLLDREKALVAIRADYTAARTQAESTAGVGPGWVVANTVTDESGAPRSVSGRALVFVPDPAAPQVIAGYDESDLPIHQPNGRWMEFDEAAFAAHYRAQAGTHLQSLAALYDTDVAGLFARHPEIWGLATSDHAINAGPPPAGRAMGDPGQLALLDLYMRDPQMAALIDAYGGQPAPATSEMARELVRIHGQQRYEQLSRLDNAMASVRQQYADALVQAQTGGTGPGWVERARTVTISDESGRTSTQTLYVTDESGQPLRDASGQPQAQMERLFDPDVFTAWYVQQDGLQHQAFKDFYGQSHTTFATDESGRTVAAGTSFDNPNWSVSGIGWMAHKELVGIDPNDPPRLHDRAAVGFDLEAGWATHHSNIKPERDWFETAIQVAMVAVVSYISAGQLGPAAASAMGLTTAGGASLTAAGIVVSAAVAGAATSAFSGLINGNLTLKGVLQGALAGGLSAGLLDQLGPRAAKAGPVGTLALRTTVQGGIQALLGGEFKDGALAGFASGLADLTAANMKASIDKAVVQETMTAAEAATAHKLARIVGSAIRAAGNPDDPANAFASSLLNDLLAQTAEPAVPPAIGLAFDDDGNLNSGVVDPNAPPAEQAAHLRSLLIAQGMAPDEAAWLAAETVFQPEDVELQPPSEASSDWTAAELETRLADIEFALDEQILAQQAREDSLLAHEDLLVEAGGPGGQRTPVRPVLNGGFDAAMNAAGDMAGLLEPLQGLRGDLAKLDALRAEARLEDMRQAMRRAGIADVPDGYVPGWDSNGNSIRDYGATADKLASAYENHLRDQRLRSNWGEDYASIRVGRSQMTVQQFEQRVLDIQQKAANAAYERGKLAIARGELPIKNNDYILTLGSYVDQQVRFELRRFGASEGLPDSSASAVFAVNRRITANGMTGIPDLRIGHRLLSDTTLAPKSGTSEQLRRWNEIRPNDTLIIRPDALGGSYVVPRSTIRPVNPPGRGG